MRWAMSSPYHRLRYFQAHLLTLNSTMRAFSDPAFFETLKVTRQNVVKLLNAYPEEQLRAIPTGFGNNLLWNAGHILVSQQFLCYAMSDLPLHIPESYAPLFRKGSSPREWKEAVDIGELKDLLVSTMAILAKDYADGIFKTYKPYTSSFGVALKNVEDALLFDHVHEGLHFGSMNALQRALKPG
jgi:hypothetical protein